jgi:glutamate/tyrosine decarboxylase-like PLP-dependent enzyme
MGTDAIRWIDLNEAQQMDLVKLEDQLNKDLSAGALPFMIVGNAGSVSTGTVDDLSKLAALCKKYDLWFHVDGAYGAPAAVLPEYAQTFKGLNEADSVAIDPHKWLYSPLEAGCCLVRNAKHLTDAFSFHPVYYNFDGSAEDPVTNYYDHGLQNSRGFRALKVWLALKQAGREGYEKLIRKDIELAAKLYQMAEAQKDLIAVTQYLSITTFRYVPADLQQEPGQQAYLNQLNQELLNILQAGGKVFLSNALINDDYCLRVCIVNFRTSISNLEYLISVVVEEGKKLDQKLRSN